ncbi:MAG: M23 family metallopeptidase [Candidatus Calescibacterium sp.]|nr:M23 family metallopeptidase [Candidatus Calescibacterium sp.]MCX7733227.1 M23 family metallopeptidase [bacterium]
MWEGNFIIPVKNYKSLKENFGARRIINGVPGAIHRGIDISAHKGEKVYASNSGIVVVARKFILEGNLIVINHGTGIYTIYAHLKDMVVGEGDFVKKGQLIGYVGNTGRSTGPHLHFGAKMGQIDINPFALFEIQDALSVALSSVNSY